MENNVTRLPRRTEIGAACVVLELKDGTIREYHGQTGVLMSERKAVPPGTWDRLLDFLRHEFGLEPVADEAELERRILNELRADKNNI